MDELYNAAHQNGPAPVDAWNKVRVRLRTVNFWAKEETLELNVTQLREMKNPDVLANVELVRLPGNGTRRVYIQPEVWQSEKAKWLWYWLAREQSAEE